MSDLTAVPVTVSVCEVTDLTGQPDFAILTATDTMIARKPRVTTVVLLFVGDMEVVITAVARKLTTKVTFSVGYGGVGLELAVVDELGG